MCFAKNDRHLKMFFRENEKKNYILRSTNMGDNELKATLIIYIYIKLSFFKERCI